MPTSDLVQGTNGEKDGRMHRREGKGGGGWARRRGECTARARPALLPHTCRQRNARHGRQVHERVEEQRALRPCVVRRVAVRERGAAVPPRHATVAAQRQGCGSGQGRGVCTGRVGDGGGQGGGGGRKA
eukprot:356191-Chlamydomonas_euryale.AAC.4